MRFDLKCVYVKCQTNSVVFSDLNLLVIRFIIVKDVREEGYSVKLMYKGLDPSPAIEFPYRSIWNPVVPPKIGFFAWEAIWGKVLTLDQLKRCGRAFANGCFLCEEDEETMDHLLIHCKRAKTL